MMYLITECADHGIKVTQSKEDARDYQAFAAECLYLLQSDGNGHFDAHRLNYDEYGDCWACCENMRIAHNGEMTDE